ncbi:MAG: hypothetical protein ACE5JL_10235 [Dehalococcoidia bacterium]
MVDQQEAKLLDAIESLVQSAEQVNPNVILGQPAELERLGLTEKVGEVKEKWLEHSAQLLEQLDGFRKGPKTPALAKKLNEAVERLEVMR